MLKIHTEPAKRDELTADGPVIFALGFRPFFSAAGFAAVILMLIWIPQWMGVLAPSQYYGPIVWHSHEMLFGYTAAVIAGFLLTAVRNWTGVNTPQGRTLAALVAIWLIGRLAPLGAQWLPAWSIALADLLFLPAIAFALKPALWRGKQKINRVFVPLLLVMATANLLVHLQALGLAQTAQIGMDVMLYLVALLVSLLAGRVVPFFTQGVIPGFEATRWPWLEQLTMTLFVGLIVLQLLPSAGLLDATVALLLALALSLRVVGWHHPGVWRIPILWVLYTGLLWMIVGFLMLALSQLQIVGINLAKHALAIGGIGVLTLGMMARVSLGHSGRPIQPRRCIVVAFIVINVATALRVFGPLLPFGDYLTWVHLSGSLWIIGFAIFCWVYVPLLMSPRVDGRPG